MHTTDGVLMVGAYGWAFVEPRRKLAYNLAVTSLSIAVAVVIAGVEVLGLAGAPWRWLAAANAHMAAIGAAIIVLFLASWAVSYLWRRRRANASTIANRRS